jgi:hypothetical protein
MQALTIERLGDGWECLLKFPAAKDEKGKPMLVPKFLPEVGPRRLWHGYENPDDMTVITHGNITLQPQTRSMPKMEGDYNENPLHVWRRTGEQYGKVGQKHLKDAMGKPIFMRLSLAKGHSIPTQTYPIEYIWVKKLQKYIPKVVYQVLGENACQEKETPSS